MCVCVRVLPSERGVCVCVCVCVPESYRLNGECVCVCVCVCVSESYRLTHQGSLKWHCSDLVLADLS